MPKCRPRRGGTRGRGGVRRHPGRHRRRPRVSWTRIRSFAVVPDTTTKLRTWKRSSAVG